MPKVMAFWVHSEKIGMEKESRFFAESLRTEIKDLIREVVHEELAASRNRDQGPKLLYNTEEAAKLLGVPKSWLGSAARKGIIPCVHVGHYVNFEPEELKIWIAKKRGKGLDNPSG